MSMTIREAIVKAMQRQGWSQYRLSKESGVAQANISRLLNDEGDMLTERADALMRVLGLTIKEERKRAR